MQVKKQLSEWDRGDEKLCLHSSADHVQRSNKGDCYGMTWPPRCMTAINSTNATHRESKKMPCVRVSKQCLHSLELPAKKPANNSGIHRALPYAHWMVMASHHQASPVPSAKAPRLSTHGRLRLVKT